MAEDTHLKFAPLQGGNTEAPSNSDGEAANKAVPTDATSPVFTAELLGDLGAMRSKIAELQQELVAARRRPMKVLGDYVKCWFLRRLSHLSPPLPSSMSSRFARSAARRNPLRSLPLKQQLEANAPDGGDKVVNTSRRARAALVGAMLTADQTKRTVMVVSHEASRTGAPIVALNLVQRLRTKYNVVSIVLGDGALLGDFQAASIATYLLKRKDWCKATNAVIKQICRAHDVVYAIVNSAESRNVLPSLKASGVPVVALVHEFAAYMRPRTAFSEIFDNSDQVIFSTRITLENALEELDFTRGAAVHVIPQGKCAVPGGGQDGKDNARERMWLDRVLRPGSAAGREFVVLGAGTVEPRKAVDLFIECATRVIIGPGGGRFRFVWIGNGYDPETGAANSMYLADQIKRAGIEGQIDLVRSTSEIEYAYELVDVLLLSSRLDPLPNVAIDALVAGKPVLCFERTTGIADFLVESGLGDSCVARYLDTTDLAAKLRALADDEALRADVAAKGREAARCRFDFGRYVDRLDRVALRIVPAAKQIAEDAAFIAVSGRFRTDFSAAPGDPAPGEAEAIKAYLGASRSGRRRRKPMPGFHPAVYQVHHEEDIGADPFVRYLRGGEPAGPWALPVIDGQSATVATTAAPRAALHLHVSDASAVADFAWRLRLNAAAPDLFVSAPEETADAARAALEAALVPTAAFKAVPARGRALGALLTGFAAGLAQDYEVVGHFEVGAEATERPAMPAAVIETIIGGETGGAMLDRVLAAMTDAPSIALVYPDDPAVLAWGASHAAAEVLAGRMALGKLPDQFNFPTASAFWCHGEVLQVFTAAGLGWADYPARGANGRSSLFDAIARLFGVIPGMIGQRSAVTNLRGVSW